jgi:hypothetical protein
LAQNAAIQAIKSTAKPAFLLSDRVYQKVTDAEEQKWLVRATGSALRYFNEDILKSEQLRYVSA